jgi:Cu+-exporting ATPase
MQVVACPTKERYGKEVSLVEKDPVCGMEVDPDTAPAESEYRGKTYYFCAQNCKGKFDKEPERYARR